MTDSQTSAPTPLVVVAVTGSVLGESTTPRVHPANTPLIYADDLAAVRGDGIFETLMVRGGELKNLERHATRFLNSAAMLDIPAPDLPLWEKASALAIEEFRRCYPEAIKGDAALRWVYSRGRESTGAPSGWITLAPMAEHIHDDRANGITVMSAERGFRLDLSQRSPWALIGAKTLSYAANMAVLRYAHEHGFDDAIFISDDGNVLEGPTSTIVALFGDTLATPPTDQGILPGTTQASLFRIAEGRGWTTQHRAMTLDDLKAADGVWLVSSVRVAARITRLDDHTYTRPAAADEIEAMAAEAVAD